MLNISQIKSTMRSLGLSQAELALQCSVSKEAVSNWLSGESIPRPNKLKALSEVLRIKIEELLGGEGSLPEPIVAYRTRKNLPVTGPAQEAASDLARHLRELVPFVRREALFAPPILEMPSLDDHYIREAAQQIRSRVGLSSKAPLSREQLFNLHHDFGSLLVPVLWGTNKAGHENALSVYLPDSKISWVIFSLNAHNDDFNYWLAHELGHCYTLHALQGDAGEEFAERFAQELLFPYEVAVDAYAGITSGKSPKEQANWYAGTYGTSIVTVIRQADRVAKSLGENPTGIESPKFWAEWKANRKFVPSIVDVLFGSDKLSAEEYIIKSEVEFKTPVFRALAQWQVMEGGRSPAFISSALNIDLGQAVELSHALLKLHSLPRKSADSLNNP